jgi:hypothetical protein
MSPFSEYLEIEEIPYSTSDEEDGIVKKSFSETLFSEG